MLHPMGASSEQSAPTPYEILVTGELSEALVEDIGARTIEIAGGKALIVVDVIDQSHLHGVLHWLQDRNVSIERVNQL